MNMPWRRARLGSISTSASSIRRAARLALDFVLTAANLRLVESEAAFQISRGADDPDGVWNLVRVLERSIGALDSTR